ncbi:SMP-30/gluconolactonase/LRE family protein [Deinococcus sp. SDU3-2]|uniref:SMP-30/gluconolactonase/LRE family protein n=1 Tax=Deinococcus terrestris TaxID=2651870 RepID=A0A7X1NTI7_9DEIO|nr:hypothetical protein [Deinococcus terrestris]MPY65551.1 SMP-30/gluconolactonase/LRE family protein [Deinococcus terrestris]
MKTLPLTSALLGLTVLLTACPGPGKERPDPSPTTYTLTLKVEGVPQAPVTVLNDTTKAEAFSGPVAGSKTLTLKAGEVFRVEGGAANGYVTPAAQTVTLDGNETVTLTYRAAAQPGMALDPARLQGTLSGWTLGAGEVAAYFSESDTVLDLTPATVTAAGAVNGALPRPPEVAPLLGECVFTGSRSVADVGVEFPELGVFSRSGDFLGTVSEETTDGRPVQRIYAAQAATFRGTADCGSVELDLDLTLRAGWNAIEVKPVGPQQQTLRVRNVAPGARVTLAFNRADERLNIYFDDLSEISLRAGASVTREAVLEQMGGISGTVTLETNVPGVTVTPSTLNLSPLGAQGTQSRAAVARLAAQAVVTRLTFTAAANAPAYSGVFNVVVKQGGREVGGGTLPSLRVIAPSVSVTVASEHMGGLYVYPGTTAGLKVNLASVEGFSGSTTVTVSDLPAGVSAQPVTVQVTPGTTTTVTIPLTVAADAAPATATVRVSSPQGGPPQGPNTVQLTVRPARVAVGSASQLVPSGDGVWLVSGGRFDSATSAYVTDLTRYVGLQAGARATVPFGVGSLTALPGGDVLAAGTDERVARITAAGEVTLLPRPTGLFGGVADAQGRVWFVQRVSEPTGGTRTALVRWTPGTGTGAGEVVVVDDKANYGQQGRLVASGDGKTLVYLPAYSTAALRIDTQAGTVRPLGADVSEQGGSVAVSDAGSVWLTQYGSVKRLNADGSVTTFNDLRVERLFGFDRQNPDVLWGADYTSIFRIDARTGTATRVQLGEVPAGVPLNGGGLAFLTADYVDGNRQSFLSILR